MFYDARIMGCKELMKESGVRNETFSAEVLEEVSERTWVIWIVSL